MDEIEGLLRLVLGLGLESKEINALQMGLRAVLVYVVTVLMVRLGKKRFMGRATALRNPRDHARLHREPGRDGQCALSSGPRRGWRSSRDARDVLWDRAALAQLWRADKAIPCCWSAMGRSTGRPCGGRT